MKIKGLFIIIAAAMMLYGHNGIAMAEPIAAQPETVAVAESKTQQQAAEEASFSYFCVLANTAAYSNELNQAIKKEMEKYGWEFDSYRRDNKRADARYYLVNHKDSETSKPELMVVIPGTEGRKDVEVDLRFGKVLFGGSTVEEFQAKAEVSKVPGNEPMVHRGFNDYTMTGFFLKDSKGVCGIDDISKFLAQNPKAHVYLTGHSLGGAVATILGARMIEAGIAQPEQITIYTYGAPAVGNEAFAQKFGSKLDLHRYVMGGDPVKNVLQMLKSGYVQFGTEYKWKKNKNSQRFSHQVIEYLDAGVRNYYDANLQGNLTVKELIKFHGQSLAALPEADSTNTGSWFLPSPKGGVLLAPCIAKLDSGIANDAPYLDVISADVLIDSFGMVQYPDDEADLGKLSELDRLFALCQMAEKNGCDRVAIRRIIGELDRRSTSRYNISTEINVYDTRGTLLKSFIASSNTDKMTVIEAVLYGMARLKEEKPE